MNDKKQIFSIAYEYYAAYRALDLMSPDITTLGDIETSDTRLVIPKVTMQIFAIELAIKSMIPYRFPKGHKLYNLFYKLNIKQQLSIKEKTIFYMDNNYNINYASNVFEIDLKNINNLFTEWRYLYENETSFYPQFINSFTTATFDEDKKHFNNRN